MTHERNQCIECVTELAIDDYECPDDPEHVIEEIYSMKCTDCGEETEAGSCDTCPQCEGELEEVD